MPDREIILVTGSSNPELARKVGEHMSPPIQVYNGIDRRFQDGETRVKIPGNVRGRPVFILQSTCPPFVDSAYIELFQLIDAAKRASAREIIAVIPYFGYGRQDRKDRPRTAITAAMMAKITEERGANRIITIDMHSEATEGATNIPWDKLYASYTLIPAIRNLDLKDPVVASPDGNGFARALRYSESLGLGEDVAVAYKRRDSKTGKSHVVKMIGDVAGRDVLYVDDIADSMNTLTDAANYADKLGARAVYAAVAHGVLSEDALYKLKDSAIRTLLITDTINPRDEVLTDPKIQVHSVAPLLAKSIEYNLLRKSISTDLIR